MAGLSFYWSDALVKLDEHQWEVSKGRLTVKETCSEGKIPAVKPDNAHAASPICPEPLLDFREFPKSSTIQDIWLHEFYCFALKKITIIVS